MNMCMFWCADEAGLDIVAHQNKSGKTRVIRAFQEAFAYMRTVCEDERHPLFFASLCTRFAGVQKDKFGLLLEDLDRLVTAAESAGAPVEGKQFLPHLYDRYACLCVCVTERERVCVCVYIYIYIYIHIHTCINIHMYTHTHLHTQQKRQSAT
jgi:hypothetical protein